MNVVPAFRMFNPITSARAGAVAVWLAVALVPAGPAFSQSANPDPIVANVNGTQIRESDIKLVDEIVGRNLTTIDPVERRETLLKMYIDTILLSQVAKERNIVDEADLQRRTTFARNQGLMNHFLSVVGRQAVTEQSIRNAYDEVVAKAANREPEVHLRHLLFLVKDSKDDASVKEAQEKANAALKRITDGEDFAAVAADVSEDTATKANGGDFGWHVRSEIGKEFADAAFTMKKDEVSLIKTAAGFHIIKLEDKRTRQPIPFEKVRGRVAAMVAANAQFELVDKLRAEAKIERLDAQTAADKEPAKKN
jgi:peptidylprolyl isomerase/peptidyl-prolyl cis-trans isomerase C